jgi:hypothetical protein
VGGGCRCPIPTNTWEPILSRDSVLLNSQNWIHNSEVLAIKAVYGSAHLIRAVVILSSVMRVVARGWAIFGDSQEWVVAVH